jgi:hypothetical protein
MTIAEGEAAGDYTRGRIGHLTGDVVDPTLYDIVPLAGDGQNRGSRFGFLETFPDDDDVDPSFLCSLMDTDGSHRDGVVSEMNQMEWCAHRIMLIAIVMKIISDGIHVANIPEATVSRL